MMTWLLLIVTIGFFGYAALGFVFFIFQCVKDFVVYLVKFFSGKND